MQGLRVSTEGGLRSHFIGPSRQRHRARSLSLEQRGLVETLAIGCHAVNRASPSKDDPILVIGTTNDPATPYVWAQSLAKQLDSGHLVTYRGEGHNAYNKSNSCVNNAVDSYLISGTVPASDPKG